MVGKQLQRGAISFYVRSLHGVAEATITMTIKQHSTKTENVWLLFLLLHPGFVGFDDCYIGTHRKYYTRKVSFEWLQGRVERAMWALGENFRRSTRNRKREGGREGGRKKTLFFSLLISKSVFHGGSVHSHHGLRMRRARAPPTPPQIITSDIQVWWTYNSSVRSFTMTVQGKL